MLSSYRALDSILDSLWSTRLAISVLCLIVNAKVTVRSEFVFSPIVWCYSAYDCVKLTLHRDQIN